MKIVKLPANATLEDVIAVINAIEVRFIDDNGIYLPRLEAFMDAHPELTADDEA